jgi:hypothetical protein
VVCLSYPRLARTVLLSALLTATWSLQAPSRVSAHCCHKQLHTWRGGGLPGVGLGVYAPRDTANSGVWTGPEFELVLAAWVREHSDTGPALGRVYLKTEILSSSVATQPLGFGYGFGVSLSIEKDPKRHFLVPYFGIEIGGMVLGDTGSDFRLVPIAGVHLWSARNVFVNLQGGYATVPANMNNLSGPRGSLGVDFTLW